MRAKVNAYVLSRSHTLRNKEAYKRRNLSEYFRTGPLTYSRRQFTLLKLNLRSLKTGGWQRAFTHTPRTQQAAVGQKK